MKRTLKWTGVIVLSIMTLGLIILFFPTWTSLVKGNNSISLLQKVKLNGTTHEIMIRGEDRNNPVIINVHGGPGASEIPYARRYQDLLETHFTIVNYDQRGSGKSYHFGEDYSGLSSGMLVNDLLALTDYISERFGQKKVILIGHSYGTYIATQAAYLAPTKYAAYIGIGQMGDTARSEMDSLNYVLSEAQAAENWDDVNELQQLAEEVGNGKSLTPRHYVVKYGGAARLMNSPDANIVRMIFSSEYNGLDVIRYIQGITHSQRNLIEEVFEKPLPIRVTKLDLPFYFIMGDYDYMTSANAARQYFDQIDADQKEFITYKDSAHYPQFEEKERFYEWMTDTFAK
ncbi:MAG: alpha/beta hydrolase [Paenibacillus sp.]|nr:alpha/beta hydrolase [Paenibacillus sp.]